MNDDTSIPLSKECPQCDDGVAVIIVPGYDGEADIDFIKCEYCEDS